MSGNTRKLLYQIFDWVLWLGALGGAMALYFVLPEDYGAGEYVAGAGLVVCILLRIPTAVHELGHLLFGLAARMRPHAVTLSLFRFSGEGVKFVGYTESYAGCTEMAPVGGEHMRPRFLLYTLGGSALCLLLGVTFLLLSVLLPYSAWWLFCGMFSLYEIGEGIRALIPACLPEGETDGEVVRSVLKGEAEAQVLLSVLTAQGILYRHSFSDVPRELLFGLPVVREDAPCFRILLWLRMLWCLSEGDLGEASAALERFRFVADTPSEEAEEFERFAPCCAGEPLAAAERSPLAGVRELEEKLAAK